TDDPASRTLEIVADLTLAHGFQGRVTAGHTCALAAYPDDYARVVIDKLARAGVHMITNPATNLMLQGRLDRQPVRRGITRGKGPGLREGHLLPVRASRHAGGRADHRPRRPPEPAPGGGDGLRHGDDPGGPGPPDPLRRPGRPRSSGSPTTGWRPATAPTSCS